ncbi:MAG: leucine-rich repeat protein [Lentihominibacter sp.]
MRHTKTNKLFVMLLAVMMAIAMMPAPAVHAEGSAYDYQPENAEHNNTNSLKMISPSDITFQGKENDRYVNQINGIIDGSSDNGISFSFAQTAGMGRFLDSIATADDEDDKAVEADYVKRNLPHIIIYDENNKIAAQYSEGKGDLEYLGFEVKNEDTIVFSIGVDHGVLDSGDYTIVFGKDISGNNTAKTLGSDIVFKFTVKASGELKSMIDKAQTFLASVTVEDNKPGCYPTAAEATLLAAINEAKEVFDSGTGDTEQASENLYQALKTFKNSRIFRINGISISGISDTLSVGDSGKVSADVTAEPDEAQYKGVTWSVVKDSTSDEPADNLMLDSDTGEWIASYNGTVFVKASSVSNPEKAEYQKVTINSSEGSVAVNMIDETDSLEGLVAKTGVNDENITSLKVFTSGKRMMSSDDMTYLKGLGNLEVLDLGNASLESIGENAFQGHKNLTKVVLPDTVISIGSNAFDGCSKLKNINIPFSVSSLGSDIFLSCDSLKTLKVMAAAPPTLPEGSSLGGTVENIVVPYSCAEDYKAAASWKNYNITESSKTQLSVSVSAPGELEAAAEKALKEKELTEQDVTNLVITTNTNNDDVYLERRNDIDAYLKNHFLNATTIDLTGIKFENDKCNANTFENRINLKHIYLPETTVNIGKLSFFGCKNLRDIEIPTAVTSIRENAFGECVRLSSSVVINAGNPPDSYGSSFPEQVKTIIVPPKYVDDYENAPNWFGYNIVPQYSLSLSSSSLTVETFKSATLTADVTTYGSCGDSVLWKSSNTAVATVSNTTDKTVTIKGVRKGTATITASDVSGTVTAACNVRVIDMPAPTVSASSASYNSVKVSWSGVEGAQKYYIYRCKSNGTVLKTWTLGSTYRSFTDTGLTTGTAYYYKVRAYKAVNGTSYNGEYSALKSGVPTLSRPATPSVSRSSRTYVKVKWKGISGETGYQVYRASSLNGKYSRVKSVKMASSKYPYAKIKAKRKATYYYKVRAYKKVGSRTVYSSFSGARAYRLK